MDIGTFAVTAAGSIVAVIFPVLKGFVNGSFRTKGVGIPPWLKKYAALFLFGLISAAIVLAVYLSANPTVKDIPWYTAFLLGFGAESTIEKLTNNP